MKNNIKAILKSNNITITSFAEQIGLSRQTVDNYMVKFECEEDFGNKKVKTLFERIVESPEAIEVHLESYKTLYEMETFIENAELEISQTKILNDLVISAVTDLKSEKSNENIYKFTNLLIYNHSNVKGYKEVAEYFLYLNSRLNLEDATAEDEIFLSNMYKLMSKFKNNKLDLDADYFEKFKNRIEEIELEVKKRNEARFNDILKNIEELEKQVENKQDILSMLESIKNIKNELM